MYFGWFFQLRCIVRCVVETRKVGCPCCFVLIPISAAVLNDSTRIEARVHSIRYFNSQNNQVALLCVKSFEERKHFRDTEFVSNDAIHINNKLLAYLDS